MAADLSHLLNVDEIKHKYEKTVKDIFGKSGRLFTFNTCSPSVKYSLLVKE